MGKEQQTASLKEEAAAALWWEALRDAPSTALGGPMGMTLTWEDCWDPKGGSGWTAPSAESRACALPCHGEGDSQGTVGRPDAPSS